MKYIGLSAVRLFFATPENCRLIYAARTRKKLLNLVFMRDIGKVKIGRCSYQFPCYHNGGMITDGILMRLEKDRF